MGRVTVETSAFEFSHGRKPSGTGSWAFMLGDGAGRWLSEMFWVYNAAYGEAKRQAVAEARRQGCCEVSVQP